MARDLRSLIKSTQGYGFTESNSLVSISYGVSHIEIDTVTITDAINAALASVTFSTLSISDLAFITVSFDEVFTSLSGVSTLTVSGVTSALSSYHVSTLSTNSDIAKQTTLIQVKNILPTLM